MSLARRVTSRRQTDITQEWDAIASVRHRQIACGKDLSYHHVLIPSITGALSLLNWVSLLDVGCGTGHLSNLLARSSQNVTGIDPSRASIEIAREMNNDYPNVHLLQETVEDYAQHSHSQHDVAVANMVLMDCLDLPAVVGAIAAVTKPGGTLIATITHPWFWPKYWAYEQESWFRYHDEVIIQAPFVISAESTDHFTTHVHRPLEVYFSCLQTHGFQVTRLSEPLPPPEIESQYPTPWTFPRYLVFEAKLRIS
jgi:2-polyprenyl-3-methyl-5-hydroxy-6-metoxy-1,4-benzoquinol methylase